MASNVTVQSVLEKICVDHLECYICTNRFRQPKLLDCLHSFCLQCLQELIQSQDPSGTKLICPLCRRETMLKGSGVADLPNNFAFSALVEEVTMQEKLLEGQGSEIKCQNCDEENQAISRCMDCAHFLCHECQKAHGRMTLMKSHKIHTLTELRSGEIVYKSKLREEIPKCGKHPDQNLNVYCNTCEQVICLMCTVLDHGNPKHSLIGLSEAFEKCKKKVEELVSKVSKSKTELNTTIEKTCTTRKKLDIMFANTKKKISEKADQEVANIRQEEQKLLTETDRIYQERITTFDAAQANNSKEVTQTEHKLEEVKQLMNQASCCEILELQQKLLHNLSELTGKQPEQVPDKLTFMDFEEGERSLGRLILEEEPKAAAKQSPRPGRSQCQKAHERMTVINLHKIYTLAQLRSGEIAYKSKLREEVPKCGKHPDQNLNVYCDTCEQVICLMCTVLDHGNPKHSLIGLSEAFEKCQKKVEELVSNVSKSKTELNTTIEKTCTNRKKLEVMFANTKKKISEKADQEVAKIRQEEQKLLKETDRIYQERITTFDAAQTNNSKEVTQTEQKLEDVKQLMNQASYYGASVFSVDMTSNMQRGGHPKGVCCDSDGSIYVAEWGYPTGDILHYSPDGKYIGCVIKECDDPSGITFTSHGDLVVAAGQSVQIYHRL
ncbi:E3 ubiquitin-protein ligase TRIM56-like [Patiria miniata]|uniref:Uncharacterized protein n=1 Tax=Patiria miniata TaxID=46514 RepID=A0A913ZTB0_PATMI|nr:E3 ubiquitin-protein ligase TRIM56-like [Patiria miniata]